MKRLKKQTVKAKIRRQGYWQGYLAMCNVSPSHIVHGWGLGQWVRVDSIEELDKFVNAVTYYNASSELGYYVAYWEA